MRLGVIDIRIEHRSRARSRRPPGCGNHFRRQSAHQIAGAPIRAPAGRRSIDEPGRRGPLTFTEGSREPPTNEGGREVLAFATSAIREATNGPGRRCPSARERLDGHRPRVRVTRPATLPAAAAAGWAGRRAPCWSSTSAGLLEMAQGWTREPDVAVSVPLGAGRVTNGICARRDDPPTRRGSRPGAPSRPRCACGRRRSWPQDPTRGQDLQRPSVPWPCGAAQANTGLVTRTWTATTCGEGDLLRWRR